MEKRNLYILFLFVIALLQVGCGETVSEKDLSEDATSKNCNCNDVFLDPEFNHFYTEKRDEPFTGVCESFYPNGQVAVRKQYENGRLEGLYLEYYESGTLKSEWNFSQGRQHGDHKGYHPDGNLKYHTIYYMGDQDTTINP